MASSLEFAMYVIDQLHMGDTITYRSMFGEYALYYNGKHFGFIADDQLLVKMTNAGKALVPDAEEALLFEGAVNPMLVIEELHDTMLLQELLLVTCSELPDRRVKRKKNNTTEM